MWIALAWKPFARFSSSSAFQKDGPRKPLVESLIDKDAVTLSLMWMLHARQHDNVHYLAIRCFLLHDAASMPSVRRATRGASGVRSSAHVPQHFRCIPVNGSARMGIEVMATIRVNWLRRFRPSKPTWRTSLSQQRRLWFVSMDNTAMRL